MRKGKTAARLKAEQLENRLLLAGNVDVRVVEGMLILRGDELDNAVSIQSGDLPGQVIVTGRPTGDPGEATTINGEEEPFAAGSVRGIRIGMGEGNDAVAVGGVGVPGSIGIATDGGDDSVKVRDVETRHLRVALGDGSNHARIGESRIGLLQVAGRGGNRIGVEGTRVRRLELRGGGEDDHVVLDEVLAGTAAIASDGGDDSVSIIRSAFGRGLGVGTGAGDDKVAIHNVKSGGTALSLGDGNDQVVVNTRTPGEAEAESAARKSLHQSLSIHDGGGERTGIVVQKVRIGLGGLAIRTRGGNDSVSVADVGVAGRSLVSTGAAADRVSITDSVFGGRFLAEVGDQDDRMAVRNSTFRGPTAFLGGEGDDTLVLQDVRFLDRFFTDFENVNPNGNP